MSEEARGDGPAAQRPQIEPYRIGMLGDVPGRCNESFELGLTLAFEESVEKGIGDRPIELVKREYAAQPWRACYPNVDAYVDLVENEKVLGVAGPMTTDNSLSVLGQLDRYEVPMISICGSQRFGGDFAFNTPNGGMADEPATIAAWLVGEGHRRVALIREAPSQIGEEYAHHLRYESAEHGFEIIAEQGISPIAGDDKIAAALERLRAIDPDCLVYFGLGALSGQLSASLARMGWAPPRIMGTAFVGAAFSERRMGMYEGWRGLDQFHEENPTFQHLMSLCEEKSGKPRPFPDSVLTCGYDIGRCFALAIARMRIGTGPALRDALETITRLPAATGAPGTVVSFSPFNHRGFQGADYLIVREVKDGRNRLVGAAPVVWIREVRSRCRRI